MPHEELTAPVPVLTFPRQTLVSLLVFAVVWEVLSHLAPALGIPPFAIPSLVRIAKSVVEITPSGAEAWAFNPADFPLDTNLDWVLGAQRLPNGNTLIPNYLGHGKNGQGIWLLEVTPEKKVVWTLRDPRIVLLVKFLP